MAEIVLIDSCSWDNKAKKLIFNFEKGDDTLTRMFRAKEVAQKYPWRETLFGIEFTSARFTVHLNCQVGCNCPDIQNRRLPCKHIFAAAYLKGDTEAILQSPPSRVTSEQKKQSTVSPVQISSSQLETRFSDGIRKWRPDIRAQDVRVGKYFMLSDFLYSDIAATRGIANCPALDDPDSREIKSIRGLCEAILDKVVAQFGPVSITYGFATPELTRLIYRGASSPGLHNCVPSEARGVSLAAAADILVHSHPDFRKNQPRIVLDWIRDNCVYDRLILFPGSSIICTAWTNKPRYHCKEWVFPDTSNFSKAIYIDAARTETLLTLLSEET